MTGEERRTSCAAGVTVQREPDRHAHSSSRTGRPDGGWPEGGSLAVVSALSAAKARGGEGGSSVACPTLDGDCSKGRVVPGKLGSTAARGAGSRLAKAAHQRLRTRAAALALLQHRHALSVPRQSKPNLAASAPCRAMPCTSGRPSSRSARATLTGSHHPVQAEHAWALQV